MKKSYVIVGIMILAAVLLVVPMQAKAEMYVEAYLGANFGSSASDGIPGAAGNPVPNVPFVFTPGGQINPAFQGGLKIGTWFVKEGVLGYNYPDWMKYLGFYLDFSYHRADFKRQNGTWQNIGAVPFQDNFFSEGYAATLAFMFAARYGFLPDSEVPFGRLQPYVAVGPAILFSGQNPTFYNVSAPGVGAWGLDAPAKSSTDICLAVEAGLRYMALKNVSVEVSYKFRYANPTYDFSGVWDTNPLAYSFSWSPTYYFHSIQVGAAYHF